MNKIKTEQPTININVAPVFKNQSKEEEIAKSDYTANEDNIVMPGIKINTKTQQEPNEPENTNNDIFNGGLIIKKT